MMCISDVPAERGWRTKCELCTDGPGEWWAAGGYTQHAGPGGFCRISAKQHTATTYCAAPIPAANTPTGTEHSTLAGQTG